MSYNKTRSRSKQQLHDGVKMMSTLYFFFEILGTVAFAVSGTIIGIRHKMDVFGVLVMSVITAVGGGIFRDLLLGNIPPTSLKSPIFITISSIASILAMLIFSITKSKRNHFNILKITRFYNFLLLVSDAIGLGIFTVLGIDAGIAKGYGHNYFFIIFLGVLTGVGGGMIRDIIANQIPMIFRENIYAVSCIIGGCLYVLILPELNHSLALLLSVLCIIIIRIVSETQKINLPRMDY